MRVSASSCTYRGEENSRKSPSRARCAQRSGRLNCRALLLVVQAADNLSVNEKSYSRPGRFANTEDRICLPYRRSASYFQRASAVPARSRTGTSTRCNSDDLLCISSSVRAFDGLVRNSSDLRRLAALIRTWKLAEIPSHNKMNILSSCWTFVC